MKRRSENAFILLHFGDKIKYLELEIYFLINLRKFTNQDILYLYSIHDTPKEFIKIIKPYCTKTIGCDDKDLTYGFKYESHYEHFNILRVCNYIFGYLCTEYKKICYIESDMIVMKNLDDIFNLKTPAILSCTTKINKKCYENDIVNINRNQTLNECKKDSFVQGGLMVFEPSKEKFKEYLENLKIVIKNNCKFPTGTVWWLSNPVVYNLPIYYNFSHYRFWLIEKNPELFDKVYIFHFNNSVLKPIDYIKESKGNFEEKGKYKIASKICNWFNHNFYKFYYEKVNLELKKIKKTSKIRETKNLNLLNNKIINTKKIKKTLKIKKAKKIKT